MAKAETEKCFKAKIVREPGYLYYFDNGNIMRVKVLRGNLAKLKTKPQPEVVLKTDIKREPGYLYYLDKQGDISRAAMQVWAKAQTVKAAKAPKAVTPVQQRARKSSTIVGGSMGLELEQKRLKNGNFTSYIKGTKILHCENGPARIRGKDVEYQMFGQLHRIGGPAMDAYGEKTWWLMGREHNLDGPACKGEGYETYYVFGTHYSKKEFDKLTSNQAFMKAARRIEKSIADGFAGLEPAEIKQVGQKAKKESSIFPALAFGLMGAGGLALAGHKMKQMSAAKAKAKVVA